MPIRFRCEHCESRVKVPDGSQGRRVRCPRCGHLQRVPAGAASAALDESDAPDEPRIREERTAAPPDSAEALAALAGAAGSDAEVSDSGDTDVIGSTPPTETADTPPDQPVSGGSLFTAAPPADEPAPPPTEPAPAATEAEAFVESPAAAEPPPPSSRDKPTTAIPTPRPKAPTPPPPAIPLSRGKPAEDETSTSEPTEPAEEPIEQYEVTGHFEPDRPRYNELEPPSPVPAGIRLAPRHPSVPEPRDRGRHPTTPHDHDEGASMLILLAWALRFLAAVLAVVLALYLTPQISAGQGWRAQVAMLTLSVSAGVLLWTVGEIAAGVDRLLRNR